MPFVTFPRPVLSARALGRPPPFWRCARRTILFTGFDSSPLLRCAPPPPPPKGAVYGPCGRAAGRAGRVAACFDPPVSSSYFAGCGKVPPTPTLEGGGASLGHAPVSSAYMGCAWVSETCGRARGTSGRSGEALTQFPPCLLCVCRAGFLAGACRDFPLWLMRALICNLKSAAHRAVLFSDAVLK